MGGLPRTMPGQGCGSKRESRQSAHAGHEVQQLRRPYFPDDSHAAKLTIVTMKAADSGLFQWLTAPGN
jgi:hypothetical protein